MPGEISYTKSQCRDNCINWKGVFRLGRRGNQDGEKNEEKKKIQTTLKSLDFSSDGFLISLWRELGNVMLIVVGG